MDMAGGTPWQRWKKERTAAGLPVVEEPAPKPNEEKAKAKRTVTLGELFQTGKTGAAAVLP